MMKARRIALTSIGVLFAVPYIGVLAYLSFFYFPDFTEWLMTEYLYAGPLPYVYILGMFPAAYPIFYPLAYFCRKTGTVMMMFLLCLLFVGLPTVVKLAIHLFSMPHSQMDGFTAIGLIVGAAAALLGCPVWAMGKKAFDEAFK
jgi:hypothetical protein